MKLVHLSTSGPLPTTSFNLVNDAGEVVGYAQVRHRPSHGADLPPEAANHIYYEIEPRHRGHGKALMGLVLDEARRIGLTAVRLTVDDDNPASRHIIESHGAVWLGKFARGDGLSCDLFEVSLLGAHQDPVP
jgi:predicted acetyltransferase